MSINYRRLGQCVEVFTREGGWVAQKVTPNGDEEYEVEVIRGGLDTKDEAVAIALATRLPVFQLEHDPNAS